MTQITAERIQELIEKSRLVDAAPLQEAFDKIREKHSGNLPSDPVAVCKELEDLEARIWSPFRKSRGLIGQATSCRYAYPDQ